jgi:hypothetical protein
MALTRMKLEANQSTSLPRSSTICIRPIASDSSTSPVQSMLRRRRGVSGQYAAIISADRMPTGRLTKNVQRQLATCVNQPPSVGPRIGPTITPMPQMAMARPRCSIG